MAQTSEAMQSALGTQARDAAVGVLLDLAHPEGFHAGAGGDTAAEIVERADHYASIWGRDAGITILGAVHLDFLPEDDPRRAPILAAARASLLTLTKSQYPNGQIHTVIWPNGNDETGGVPYGDCGECGGVDAVALYVIALREYLRARPDPELRDITAHAFRRAIEWLLMRDDNQEGIINSPQAGDWIESTFVRSGKILYNNVLLCEALRAAADLSDGADAMQYAAFANDLARRINFAFWPEENGEWRFMVGPLGTQESVRRAGTYPHPARQNAYRAAYDPARTHYISHIEYAEFVDKCDVFANVLAVLYDIATPERAHTIMEALYQSVRERACPAPTYLAPVDADDPSHMYKAHIERLQGERWRNAPGDYHNGGIWPFIGGFYVEALVKAGMVDEAAGELERLARVNLETDFNEWLNHHSGKPGGNPRQGWNAAALLRAYAAVTGAR